MNTLPDPVSFESALRNFAAYLKSQNRSTATIVAYRNDIEQLGQYLLTRRITQATTVQTTHLQDYLAQLATKSYTAKSISRKINSIKTFFKFLAQEKTLGENPALPLTHPKYETKPPRILTPVEYRSLRDACRLDIRVCAVVELLLQTGIRISELANLRIEDVKKNELVIRSWENNPGRTVPLNRSASIAIQNYLAIRPAITDDHLFVTKTGHPLLIRNIRTSLDRYFRLAGVKNVKVNDLRHTFIAHQLSAGVDPKLVAQIVGHRRLSSTEKYLDYVKAASPTTSKLAEL